MRDEHPVSTGKLLIWYALGIRLAHARMSAHEHCFHGPLTPGQRQRLIVSCLCEKEKKEKKEEEAEEQHKNYHAPVITFNAHFPLISCRFINPHLDLFT
jgi:fructoselysine-6-P-deglycase FrlB-like protein